jgi:hypothetical protein
VDREDVVRQRCGDLDHGPREFTALYEIGDPL